MTRRGGTNRRRRSNVDCFWVHRRRGPSEQLDVLVPPHPGSAREDGQPDARRAERAHPSRVELAHHPLPALERHESERVESRRFPVRSVIRPGSVGATIELAAIAAVFLRTRNPSGEPASAAAAVAVAGAVIVP